MANKAEEFIDQLEQEFEGQDVSYTDINDMLWFEPEECFKLVGLDENGNECDGEEEEDEDEY